MEHRIPSFPLGAVVATANVLDSVSTIDILAALGRHAAGDWGEVGDEDRASNERALAEGERLLSVFTARNGCKLWVITEWERSVTTVLLPEDY